MSKSTMCKICGHDPCATRDRIPTKELVEFKKKYRAIMRLRFRLARLEEEFENYKRGLYIYDTGADLVCAQLEALREALEGADAKPHPDTTRRVQL